MTGYKSLSIRTTVVSAWLGAHHMNTNSSVTHSRISGVSIAHVSMNFDTPRSEPSISSRLNIEFCYGNGVNIVGQGLLRIEK